MDGHTGHAVALRLWRAIASRGWQRPISPEGRRRYAAILAAALRKVAAEPPGPSTRERTGLLPGIRSVRLRHARDGDPEAKVRRPVHILYYRALAPGLIEIVRVLHERMEPARHPGTGSAGRDR